MQAASENSGFQTFATTCASFIYQMMSQIGPQQANLLEDDPNCIVLSLPGNFPARSGCILEYNFSTHEKREYITVFLPLSPVGLSRRFMHICLISINSFTLSLMGRACHIHSSVRNGASLPPYQF